MCSTKIKADRTPANDTDMQELIRVHQFPPKSSSLEVKRISHEIIRYQRSTTNLNEIWQLILPLMSWQINNSLVEYHQITYGESLTCVKSRCFWACSALRPCRSVWKDKKIDEKSKLHQKIGHSHRCKNDWQDNPREERPLRHFLPIEPLFKPDPCIVLPFRSSKP